MTCLPNLVHIPPNLNPRQDNTRRGQIQWGPYPEADLGRCEWREGCSASQSRCVYAPDRGCTGWEAAPEILVSPAMSDEATHGFGPGLVSGLREISQAFQQGLPDPVASSWLDVSGWVLDELNTDAWSDVVRASLHADPSSESHHAILTPDVCGGRARSACGSSTRSRRWTGASSTSRWTR